MNGEAKTARTKQSSADHSASLGDSITLINADKVFGTHRCCGYVKGIALDPSGWKPFIEEHPDWFEVIHLYGTESGRDRLKESVEAYQDADARHQGFVELIAPAARNIHAYWLARRAPAPDTIGDTRRPIHKVPVPGRNDRCPCGSGKKFKHCHGAPQLLH